MAEKTKKISRRIGLLVGIQIAIILASFIILESFETQKVFLGNSVNVAGKNRFYTAMVLNEVKDYYIRPTMESPIPTLGAYENNLELLRNGGVQKDTQLSPLPEKFHAQWESIHELFLNYKAMVQGFTGSDAEKKAKLDEISQTAAALVEQNDALTSSLAMEVQSLTTNLIWLQIYLAAVNIGIHVFMIKMIYGILKKETERLIKMERLYTVGQMAARLAHDMKNPLAVIKIAVSLLLHRSDKADEETKNEYRLIETSVNRMVHQIEGVMDFVRTRQIQLEENSIKEIIRSASLTTDIPQNIKLNLPENDIRLRCDRKQTEVLLSNLISNAAEAIGDVSGTVTIRLDQDLQNVLIEVEDSGPGIPKDVLPKIFEPLFTTKHTGTGLGLVSCKNIVEAHKGTITVKNNPTRFTISIPKILN
ncbi:MAG: HAMP domain-containing histidine kinase [Candidatus Nitrosotenuis sp.]|nr:MAG: HAMP domain-containing histidine kinase [Candidatus Nitrosotenuis sp.]